MVINYFNPMLCARKGFVITWLKLVCITLRSTLAILIISTSAVVLSTLSSEQECLCRLSSKVFVSAEIIDCKGKECSYHLG